MTTIAYLNESSAITDSAVEQIIAALQIQIDRDWQPVWGNRANLVFVPKGQSPPAGAWWIGFFDNSDQAGALGYHDLTNEGLPLGKLFVVTCQQYNTSVSVDASHETLEMLGDPDVNLCAQVGHTLYAYEVCDPVEADRLGYTINGVLVSDFVYPEYFESFWPQGATKFDQSSAINKPLTLAPGGYLSYLNFRSTHGWQQKFANHTENGPVCSDSGHYLRPRLGSRREKRRTERENWILSRA